MNAIMKCYYDSMIQKGRYLFKLIARNTENPFQVIETYMRSDYRKAIFLYCQSLMNHLFLAATSSIMGRRISSFIPGICIISSGG